MSYKRSNRDGAFINDKLKRGWHLIDVWLDIYNRVQQISFINNTAIVPIRNVTWERVALGATRAPWPATIPLQSADWEPQVVGKQQLITRRYSAQRLYSLHICVRCQKLLESTSKFMSLRVRSVRVWALRGLKQLLHSVCDRWTLNIIEWVSKASIIFLFRVTEKGLFLCDRDNDQTLRTMWTTFCT